ncbi:MAG: DUF951 domain-containing protein [Solirubrobacterales bacterium]
MQPKQFGLGDRVKMKKRHPCGSAEWIVTRVGADVKIKCTGCDRLVMMTRADFEKNMVAVIKPGKA